MKTSKTTFEIEETEQTKCRVVDSSIRQDEQRVADSWIIPLCVSHAAAAWGERSWEFGAGLLLLQLNGSQDRLRLTAILVLAECAVCSLLGPRIGRAVDRASFLGSAVLTLAIQSTGITVAAGLLLWAFDKDDNLWLAMGAIACSVMARLGSLGSTISIEKRWATALSHHTQYCYGRLDSQEHIAGEPADGSVEADEERVKDDSPRLSVEDVSIASIEADEERVNVDSHVLSVENGSTESKEADGLRVRDDSRMLSGEDESKESTEADGVRVKDDSRVLSRVNARLRCIDLTCNLCAPIAVGFLLETISPAGTAMSIAAFNALAWPVEVICLVWIHRHYRDVLSPKDTPQAEADGDSDGSDAPSLCEEWTLYYKQTIFQSALALAVLYLSVVSFGTIMTAWLAASGFHAGHLGAARAVAALSGMLSTVTTPRLAPSLGVESTGLWYIWFMWACILPCTLAAFYSSLNANFLWIIVVSVIVSRFGLWGFDLCVTQMLQEHIEPPEKIGEVNGTQVALQNAFDALAALVCVVLPNPDTFAFLILGSFGSVTVAALLHTSQWKADSD